MSPYSPPTPSERRVRRAIQRAERDGTEITVAAIAHAAKVDRTFIYRRPGLLAKIRDGAAEPEGEGSSAYPVWLPQAAVALIDEARGEMPRAQWLRVAALEKLSRDAGIPLADLETARRAAPRRRNYSERTQEQQRQE